MIFRFLYISVLFVLLSCDFNDPLLAVSDVNQDELFRKVFSLNPTISRTVQNYPLTGESPMLYSGQLDSNNYSYTIINFDKSIFQNYDLCSQDSLSYKKVYLVMDLVNEYQLINGNNNQDDNINNDFNDDTPPMLTYWIKRDSLGLQIDEDWSDSVNIITDFHLSNGS